MSSRTVLLVLVAALGGCQEYGYTSNTQLDVFQQNRKREVDLLLVIDNSCSMWEEQDNLARNFDSLIDTFSNADVDWQIGVTTTDTESDRYRGVLMGGDDEVIVRSASGGELDRVQYDREWAFEEGVSLQLDGNKHALTDNDQVSNWCASTDDFGDGMKGTPGVRNDRCNGSKGKTPSGPDAGPVAPSPGEVVVSEIMAWSGNKDTTCEWVELANTTSDTLDLSGVEVADDGRNSAILPDGTELAPGGVIVVGRSTDSKKNCDTPVDVGFAEGFSLNNDVRVLNGAYPDARELFSELVAQGTIGTGIEMGLEAARLSFTDEFYGSTNPEWLRDDATLSMLFVSDEDDLSPYAVDDYIRAFSELKGDQAFREDELVQISAVVGSDLPASTTVPSCETENGFAAYAERYLAAATRTGGLVESICERDFAPIVEQLGLTLSGLEVDFFLSSVPKLETMTVLLYENEETESLVRELVRDEDFTYVIDGNLLHFEDDQIPPSGHYITVEYEPLPTGGEIVEGEE